MANVQANLSIGGKVLPVTLVDQNDGTYALAHAVDLRGWDATALAPSKLLVDHATGALLVTSAGGSGTGGGAVTVADGADTAQGTTTDPAWSSGAGTVISLLKKIASAGGSAVSIADGADVAQGTTTDASSAETVIGLLKAVKAAITGTLTVATHAVTQSGVWTVARSWTLSSATDSVNVGNFPATQPVSGAVSVSNLPATQPVSGSVSVGNFPATQKTDDRQYTPLGAFRVGMSAALTGAASTQNVASIENPVGSGRTVRIKRVEIQGVFASTTASATAFLYHVGRTTGIPSGGATQTAQKHATADAAPVAIVRSGTTAITATAATGDLWTTSPGTGSPNSPAVLPMPIFAEGRDDDDIILAAGEALLVRADTNTTSWKHSVDFSWVEY